MSIISVMLSLAMQAPRQSASPRLSSVFVELAAGRAQRLDASGWAAELDAMAKIGVRSVITKFSASSAKHYPVDRAESLYPSTLPWLMERFPGHDAIELLLTAADAHNFTVHLGHWEDMAWFNRSNHNQAFLRLLATRAVAVSEELHRRYGAHTSFVGLYDPNEPNGRDWPDEQGAWLADLVYGPVWGWARAHGYLTSTAPFWFNSTAPADDVLWWDTLLSRLPRNTLSLAWLDDDQASNFYTVQAVVPFYAAWAKLAEKHNVSVWSDCVDHNHTDQPQPISHFVAQLQAEAPFVQGFTTFEWFFYLAPASGQAQAALYAAYAAYIRSLNGGAGSGPAPELPTPTQKPPVPTPTSTIELRAEYFVLSIEPSTCNATMTWISRAGFQPTPLKGKPTAFVSLYNRVADNRPENMAACRSVALVEHQTDRSKWLLRVAAAHDYGSIDFAVTVSGAVLNVSVHDTSAWKGDPVEKHIMFGEWWSGLLDNATAPIVMGKLQGPRATPGPTALAGAPSAGYMTLSDRGYYKYLFYAETGDTVAFTACPTPALAAILAATTPATAATSPQRTDTWLWSSPELNETNREKWAKMALRVNATVLFAYAWDVNLATDRTRFPHGLKDTSDYLASRGLRFGLHMHPDIVYPCAGSWDGHGNNSCFESGVGISPVVLDCPTCMVPEGLAPTYRSGDPPNPGYTPRIWTEDLGFWWCHEREGATSCPNGNKKPCGQGSCNRYDWNMTWGVNLTLHGSYEWSGLGAYRIGGAPAFDGAASTYGEVVLDEEMRSSLSGAGGMTLGLVAHPTRVPHAAGCLANLSGVFSLCANAVGALEWTVHVAASGEKTVVGKTILVPGSMYIVKATYNATSHQPRLFVNGKDDVVITKSPPPPPPLTTLSLMTTTTTTTTMARLAPAAAGAAIHFAAGFAGALEEIFLKNVSTENRVGYVYADNNRRAGTYLLDLSRDDARAAFAKHVVAPAKAASISTMHWDGFEKLQLIAGMDFPHSNRTIQSGLYRGHPSPDWYHFEGWPLRWGLGVLRGMSAAHKELVATVPASRIPAIEASFQGPGLGIWRPDMAPYVDERGDLLDLGLEWHAKMLMRMELTDTMINAYKTRVARRTTPYAVDYWFGGLVSGGIAPQLYFGNAVGGSLPTPAVLDRLRGWINRYKSWGHALEGHVHTLNYDAHCCHVQGQCEWVACDDAVFAALVGGTEGETAPSGGLVLGSPEAVVVPPALFGGSATSSHATPRLVVFQTSRVSQAQLTAGWGTDRRLAIILTSPAPNATTAFRQGFFALGPKPTLVVLTITDADGKLVDKRTLFDGKPASGNVTFVFERAREAPSLPPPLELLFEKRDAPMDAP